MKEITKEEFDRRRGEENNLTRIPQAEIVKIGKNGRRIGNVGREGKEIPMDVRVLIGTVAQHASAQEVAEVFDVSKATVDNSRNGKISGRADPELRERIHGLEDKIADKAAGLLLKSLGMIEDKENEISKLSVKELVGVGIGLASIKDRVTPKEVKNEGGQVIIFAPTMNEVTSYPVVEIRKEN